MNLYGLSAVSNVNRARRQIGTGGFLASSTGGGGGNSYPGTGSSAGLLPGGRIPVSPSQSGQPRSLPGVDFPVLGYPETGWDSSQRNPYGNMIPGAGGEPQVITTQNIPPNDASRLPINTFYPNLTEFGGGPNAPTYGSPGAYPMPDMNVPTNEDVTPTPIDTFYGSTAFNPGQRRPSSEYPDLSGLPPVDAAGSNRYDPNTVPDAILDLPPGRRGVLNRLQPYRRLVGALTGLKSGTTPTGTSFFRPQEGETWVGGGVAGLDPATGNPVYNPLGYGTLLDQNPGVRSGVFSNPLRKLYSAVSGRRYGQTPTGSGFFTPVPGEHWVGGGVAGTDPGTGRSVYNPLGYGNFRGSSSPGGFQGGGGGGLTSGGGGGWQTVSELPGGLGGISYAQALSGGGGPRVYQL